MGFIIQMMRSLFIGVVLAYCITMLGLVSLWKSGLDTWWVVLTNIFALYFFIPLLFLIPLMPFMRSGWFRASTLTLTVVFLVLFKPYLVPEIVSAEGDAHLRVMTLNVLFSNRQADAVISTIRSQNADVVALQELPQPLAAALRQQLHTAYPYQLLEPAMPPYGLGLLSRYPFESIPDAAGFAHQRVVLDVRGQPVTLINIHLTPPRIEARDLPLVHAEVLIHNYNTGTRAEEISALLQAIDTTPGPLVVLGDFNLSDREQPYTAFAARLHDAHAETAWGLGATFPTNTTLGRLPIPFPLVRIDYIWSGGGITPLRAHTACNSPGSDHCMVIADLHIAQALGQGRTGP